MFASYKSQSTGNQGEANDIIIFYITQKWSPCPGKGKTIWKPTNGQHTMKREVRLCASIHRHQQEFQDLLSQCRWPRVEPSLLSWPVPILRQAFSLNDYDVQRPPGACSCQWNLSPTSIPHQQDSERRDDERTKLQPGPKSLSASGHPSWGIPVRGVQSLTGFQWNKILIKYLILQCLRYHTAAVFNVMSSSMVMFC